MVHDQKLPVRSSGTERLPVLDALRGFALFGILLGNISVWSAWDFLDSEQQLALAGETQIKLQAILAEMLVEGKFYTLFSLLFGVGFALQLDRLEHRRGDGLGIFRRRMTILFIIGLIHFVFIWAGDILTLYALLGFTLPFFRRWSDAAIAAAATVLILLPLPGVALFEALGWAPHEYFSGLTREAAGYFGLEKGQDLAWLQREDLGSYFSHNLIATPARIAFLLESWRIPKVLGVMLLGMLAGRCVLRGTLLSNRPALYKALVAGLAVGLPFSYLYAATEGSSASGYGSVIGTVPLGIAYAAAFLLAWQKFPSAFQFLVAPGRMALTNYILQSLALIAIFTGVGAGFIGNTAPAHFYALAIAIFSAQVVLSNLWLRHFPQGPLEHLWRLGTYGGRKKERAAFA